MFNNKKDKIISSFDQIALLPDRWDYNRYYENLLLKNVPEDCDCSLDIGCGTGEFTKKLSKISKNVVGIDISKKMIDEAKKRHQGENIEYINIDIENFNLNQKYDFIISISAFHHINIDKIFSKIKSLLNNNGVFIILDLYKRKGLIDFFLNIFAIPINFLFKLFLLKFYNKQEKNIWKEHSKLDNFMEYDKIKSIYSEYFNNYKIKRLLFWRYIMIYIKK